MAHWPVCAPNRAGGVVSCLDRHQRGTNRMLGIINLPGVVGRCGESDVLCAGEHALATRLTCSTQKRFVSARTASFVGAGRVPNEERGRQIG